MSAQVAEAYLLQLAAYRLAVSASSRSSMSGPPFFGPMARRIMEIPAAMLDAAQQRLWQLDPANLDA